MKAWRTAQLRVLSQFGILRKEQRQHIQIHTQKTQREQALQELIPLLMMELIRSR